MEKRRFPEVKSALLPGDVKVDLTVYVCLQIFSELLSPQNGYEGNPLGTAPFRHGFPAGLLFIRRTAQVAFGAIRFI